MARLVRSNAAKPNKSLIKFERKKGQGNLSWGEQVVVAMGTGDSSDWTYVALLGGGDTMAYRLRIAQAHLRPDMLPSYWSEAILVELRSTSLKGARAIHVPLLQPDSREFATTSNGVLTRALRDFDDPQRFPNIALIALPVPQAEILKHLEKFKKSRSSLDALEHVLRWLAFAWGAARTPNPLHENYGLPSACMLETVFAAAGIDLTPGLESRTSCPEAIWVAARYWHDYFNEFKGKVPTGGYWISHSYPIE